MNTPILYIDRSRIRQGRLPELRPAIERLSAFIRANNPHVLSYRFFVDDQRREMTVISEHPDSAALAHHMTVGDDEFRRFGDLLDILSISVFGDVDDDVVERLNAKARALGNATVSVHRHPDAGFARVSGT